MDGAKGQGETVRRQNPPGPEGLRKTEILSLVVKEDGAMINLRNSEGEQIYG